MVRPLKYDWESKKSLIRNLYLDRNIRPEEMGPFLTDGHGTQQAPSARMIKYYINRWGFRKEDQQAKQSKAVYRDDPHLVELVRSLWKQNLSQDKILRALNEFEGYPNITDRQLK